MSKNFIAQIIFCGDRFNEIFFYFRLHEKMHCGEINRFNCNNKTRINMRYLFYAEEKLCVTLLITLYENMQWKHAIGLVSYIFECNFDGVNEWMSCYKRESILTEYIEELDRCGSRSKGNSRLKCMQYTELTQKKTLIKHNGYLELVINWREQYFMNIFVTVHFNYFFLTS